MSNSHEEGKQEPSQEILKNESIMVDVQGVGKVNITTDPTTGKTNIPVPQDLNDEQKANYKKKVLSSISQFGVNIDYPEGLSDIEKEQYSKRVKGYVDAGGKTYKKAMEFNVEKSEWEEKQKAERQKLGQERSQFEKQRQEFEAQKIELASRNEADVYKKAYLEKLGVGTLLEAKELELDPDEAEKIYEAQSYADQKRDGVRMMRQSREINEQTQEMLLAQQIANDRDLDVGLKELKDYAKLKGILNIKTAIAHYKMEHKHSDISGNINRQIRLAEKNIRFLEGGESPSPTNTAKTDFDKRVEILKRSLDSRIG